MMDTDEINIKNLIQRAAEIIAPLWPMQTFIARNPLQCLESINFEEAVEMGQMFFAADRDQSNEMSEVNRQMIKWCQAFLDEGQAAITMPEREKGFYRAWILLAPFDRKLKTSKIKDWLSALPSEPESAILLCLKKLRIPDDQIEEYLKFSLAELPGWAGYIKWRSQWQNKVDDTKNPINLTDFLAVRLLLTCAIEEEFSEKEFKKSLHHSKRFEKSFFNELKGKEQTYLQNLLNSIMPKIFALKTNKEAQSRPDAQIVFCIDVRSEPFRLRIERQGHYETLGFAGFFGLPVSIHNYHTDQIKDFCPVLLKPLYTIYEEPVEQDQKKISYHRKRRRFLHMCRAMYQDLKYNFGTPFALVETLGVWCGLWMALRTVAPKSSVKLKKALHEKITPTIPTVPRINIPLEQQIIYAESALRMMGLTKNFSQLVVFCGHRSQTENNPYASALDCGACGGNHGGQNGKLLAAILNSQEVRAALAEKGIVIPEDTQFLGAEHNTTTDEVVLEDCSHLNHEHKQRVEKLKADFIRAGIANSHSRCQTFGLNHSAVHSQENVLKRSSDWSEVRPEWGLARNAAFIVGPRSLTKELSLEGRCFLHSYEWNEDEEGKCLETILTAPMVVAEWINTQYFFSTLNNSVYGSGSKITHNVTGKFGVMQGNSSDLMHGLPVQSVNISDDHPYHEPLRLQALVYAPRARIERLVEKHAILQTLIFNQWVILTAIDPLDNKPYQMRGKAEWQEISVQAVEHFLGQPKSSKKALYQDKICVLATLHEKEKAIAPAFSDLLGMEVIKAEIDTDVLGTFTGEIERKGTPLECAREKCKLAVKESKFGIGLSSEGSFGPHPYIPFLTCNHEILYFMDLERGFEIHQSILSTKTNHCAEAFSDPGQLKAFCDRALFPSHGLIVRPNTWSKNKLIYKGIKTYDQLEEAFFKCCRLSEDGKALVETDMRAHMNPTRMAVIKELADSLAMRLATPCPECHNPGWGLVETKKGLKCEICGLKTDLVEFEILGCPKCLHQEIQPRKDGLTQADPRYCEGCNP